MKKKKSFKKQHVKGTKIFLKKKKTKVNVEIFLKKIKKKKVNMVVKDVRILYKMSIEQNF